MNAREGNRLLGVYSAAVVIALTAPRVWSQQSKQAVLTGSISTTSLTQSILDRDERLRQKVTIERREVYLAEVLRTLRRETGVRLVTNDISLQTMRGNLSLRDLPLKDVMDAIAAIANSVWERVDAGTYLLQASDTQNSLLLPSSELERAKFQDGLDFARIADTLPPNVQQKLADDSGTRLADLPIQMQDMARRMLTAEVQLWEAKNPKDRFAVTTDSLGLDATVRLDRKPGVGFTDYRLVVGTARGGMNISFNNLEQARRARAARLAATTYDPRKFDVIARGSEKQEAVMRQTASLTLQKATPAQALRQLAGQTGLNFVTLQNLLLPGAQNVALPTMPLADLLDQLMTSYENDDERMTWKLRKSGVVVAYLEGKPALPPSSRPGYVGAG